MSRLDNFDLAKAFAIVLVVIGHFYPSDSPEWYVLFRSWMYTFHMPLFMFISGYIYIAFKKDEKKIEFVKKKVQRLMLPYIVVSVLIISLKLLSQKGMFVENPVTFFSYVQCLYKPSAGYFLWFVWSLFSCFLIIPFFKSPASRLILFVIAVLLHYIVPAINITAFALNETQRNFMWFVLGCCICDCKCCKSLNICETKWYLIFKGLVLLFFVGMSVIFFGKGGFGAEVLSWLGISSVMVCATWVSTFHKSRLVALGSFIGKSSFVIYLFHTTFEGFAKALVCRIDGYFPVEFAFVFSAILCISVGLVCPILLTCFLKRFNITRILFGVK